MPASLSGCVYRHPNCILEKSRSKFVKKLFFWHCLATSGTDKQQHLDGIFDGKHPSENSLFFANQLDKKLVHHRVGVRPKSLIIKQLIEYRRPHEGRFLCHQVVCIINCLATSGKSKRIDTAVTGNSWQHQAEPDLGTFIGIAKNIQCALLNGCVPPKLA